MNSAHQKQRKHGAFHMKKMTKRKLVLGREVVVALPTELEARMQEARGGQVLNSQPPVWLCSGGCQTIDR
jgi:ribosomal protein S8E